MVGESPSMLSRRLTSQIAPADVPVLVTGESGTGKEVVARASTTLSPRARRPLIKISCARIPETLIESELFGYEAGAFTGADAAQAGRFQLAHRGTLFLDEIGEMATPMQASSCACSRSALIRLGGTRPIPVDVRLVSATNVDLARAMTPHVLPRPARGPMSACSMRRPRRRPRRGYGRSGRDRA